MEPATASWFHKIYSNAIAVLTFSTWRPRESLNTPTSRHQQTSYSCCIPDVRDSLRISCLTVSLHKSTADMIKRALLMQCLKCPHLQLRSKQPSRHSQPFHHFANSIKPTTITAEMNYYWLIPVCEYVRQVVNPSRPTRHYIRRAHVFCQKALHHAFAALFEALSASIIHYF